MRVASVVAANGTGHFRRSVGVLHRLAVRQPSLTLTVYCTNRQLVAMQSWRRLQELSDLGARFVTDFECGFPWPIMSAGSDLLVWRDRLANEHDIRSADLIVSDNLGGVLGIRPDAVLMGSFLWSEVLGQADLQPQALRFVADELDCLRKYRPPMLCVSGIVTPGVLAETNAVQLAWMCEQSASQPRALNGSPRIGICGGTTGAATKEVVQLAQMLASRYDVVVDAAAGPQETGLLPNVRRGLLRDIPLDNVDIVLCRPGAGTVMDCVAANIPFLTFFEPDSPEMTHTAARLAERGVADPLPQPLTEGQVLTALGDLAVPANYRAASARLLELPKKGLDEAADWLFTRTHR